MKNELIQSVIDAASKPVSVVSVSVGSIGTGAGAYFEILSPVVGFLAALAGLTLSVMLAIKTFYSIKVERLRIKELEEA